MNILGFGKSKLPDILKNPFQKIMIENINVSVHKKWNSNEFYSSGWVKFSNGDTQGQQDFKGQTFDEVVLKIKAFIEELQ